METHGGGCAVFLDMVYVFARDAANPPSGRFAGNRRLREFLVVAILHNGRRKAPVHQPRTVVRKSEDGFNKVGNLEHG